MPSKAWLPANSKNKGKIPLKEIAEQIDSPSFYFQILPTTGLPPRNNPLKKEREAFELDTHKPVDGGVISFPGWRKWVSAKDVPGANPECSGLPAHLRLNIYLEIKEKCASFHNHLFPIMELIKKMKEL